MLEIIEKFAEKRWFSLTITLIIAAIIFYLSSKSSPPGPKGINLSVLYHIVIFFWFAFFLFFAAKGRNKIKLKHILITIIISVLYSASDEIHQAFVPYRSCTFQDFLTNTAGIFVSSFLLILIYSKKADW